MNTELYSEKDEMHLLGGCMNDAAILYECIEKLSPNVFHIEEHKELFKVLKFMYQSKFDTHHETVLKFLCDTKNQYIPARVVINSALLGDQSIDVKYYVERILKLYTKRSMFTLAEDMLSEINSSDDIFDLKKRYSKKLDDLDGYSTKDFVSNKQIFDNFQNGKNYIEYLDQYLEDMKNGIDCFEGLRSGYPQLDQMIGGFQNGTSTIIGARSSSGKTTLIINLIANIMKSNPNANIGFFSLEMRKESIFEKLLYTIAGVKYSDVKEGKLTPEGYHHICYFAQKAAHWPVYQFDFPGIKISQMKSAIKKAISRNKINICFIDYLTKIQGDYRTGNKHQEIDQVSKGIQECAQEFNIPFVTLAQLNRQAVGRTDKRPVMADLRESGSIEEDADSILLLHRPKHYDTSLKEDLTEIFVAKNRLRGDLGKITFRFDKGILIEIPTVEDMVQGAMMTPQEDKENDSAWGKRYVTR